MSAMQSEQKLSPTQISNAAASEDAESSSIHPITWMAIGGGLIGVIVVLAVLLGFFVSQTKPAVATSPANDSKAVATTKQPVTRDASESRGDLWDELVDETPASPTGPPAQQNAHAARGEGNPTVGEAAPSLALPESTPKQLSPEDLYEQVAPSVVTVKVKDDDEKLIATGSGFFVDKELVSKRFIMANYFNSLASQESQNGTSTKNGYVLTNYHVIRPAVSADITLLNGDEGHVWQVVAEDENADLALLSVTVKTSRTINAIPLARDDPRVLATVFAIGSPKGLSGSASEGKVSGFRELPEGGRWLQTTAPISHGSSGGPLLLADGTLAGVNTLTLKDAQNVNFAVPASKVRAFLLSEYRPRHVAKGASVRWQEDDAFMDVSVLLEAAKSPHSNSEKNAGRVLERAREELRDVAWDKSGQKSNHYEQAFESARQAEQSLPNEFKYLAHYIMGQSSIWLAWESSNYKASRTADERTTRYRASDAAKAAMTQLTQATSLNPNFSPAYRYLAVHHRSCGNWSEALLASDSLVKLMPRCAEALQSRADCYDKLGKYESAKDDLKAAIELAPRDGSLHDALSGVFLSLGEYTNAIASSENALEDPKYPAIAVHVNLGHMYQRVGQFQKAISHLEKAKAMGWPAAACDQEIAKCKQRLR